MRKLKEIKVFQYFKIYFISYINDLPYSELNRPQKYPPALVDFTGDAARFGARLELRYLDLHLLGMHLSSPPPPAGRCRKHIFKGIYSSWFDLKSSPLEPGCCLLQATSTDSFIYF